MRLIIGGRASGKTTLAVQRAAIYDLTIVCADYSRCKSVECLAQAHNLSIRQPITFAQYRTHLWKKTGDERQFILEDAHAYLDHITGGTLDGVTVDYTDYSQVEEFINKSHPSITKTTVWANAIDIQVDALRDTKKIINAVLKASNVTKAQILLVDAVDEANTPIIEALIQIHWEQVREVERRLSWLPDAQLIKVGPVVNISKWEALSGIEFRHSMFNNN